VRTKKRACKARKRIEETSKKREGAPPVLQTCFFFFFSIPPIDFQFFVPVFLFSFFYIWILSTVIIISTESPYATLKPNPYMQISRKYNVIVAVTVSLDGEMVMKVWWSEWEDKR